MQPEHLGFDKFTRYDPEEHKLESNVDPESIFAQMGGNGLISFTDFVFLLTVLSSIAYLFGLTSTASSFCLASARHFQLAFKMFDLNGDGELDATEFEQVRPCLEYLSPPTPKNGNDSFEKMNVLKKIEKKTF